MRVSRKLEASPPPMRIAPAAERPRPRSAWLARRRLLISRFSGSGGAPSRVMPGRRHRLRSDRHGHCAGPLAGLLRELPSPEARGSRNDPNPVRRIGTMES